MPWQQQLLLFELLANTGKATTARQARPQSRLHETKMSTHQLLSFMSRDSFRWKKWPVTSLDVPNKSRSEVAGQSNLLLSRKFN